MKPVLLSRIMKDESPMLVGSKSFVNKMNAFAVKIQGSGSNLVITGETGTGKSLLAKFIHNKSLVYKSVLKTISLNEIPEHLFESELFGYRKGAFTGAVKDYEGKIKVSDGGTIILEDISCLPLHLQAKILRMVQDKEFERIGQPETIEVDIRIIATSNKLLEELVMEGKFREDLFYRLNILNIELLPLRKRKEDIEPFANFFLHKFSAKQGKRLSNFSHEALDALMNYLWPGNIRQLESEIERAVTLANAESDMLTECEFSMSLKVQSTEQNELCLYNDKKTAFEREQIFQALSRNKWNKSKTARELGISRRTLYNMLIRLGLSA